MNKRNSGFSLVEVMVTLTIFSLIIGVAVGLMITGKASWYISTAHIELQQDLRRGMDWVIDELRHASADSIIDVPPNDAGDDSWYNSISFYKPSGVTSGYITWDMTPIQYTLGGLNNRQLLRIVPGEQRVLANNILSFQVRRYKSGPGIVEVELQAEKRSASRHLISDSITFEAKLRN